MVSFLLVETGTGEEVSGSQHSRIWESGLMAAFFDSGYIVTNGPIIWMEQKPETALSGEIGASFNKAVTGGADYFVVGFFEYSVQEGRAVPSAVVVYVYDSSSRQLIYQRSFSAGEGRNAAEETQIAQNAGRAVISRIKDR